MREKMINFFQKIKEFFKNIFAKNKTQLLEEPKENSLNNNLTEQKISYQKEKNEFFEIYNKIKKGQYDLNNLTKEQAEKIIEILNSEIDLKKEKLGKSVTELNILKTENRLEEKNRIFNLYKQIKEETIDLSEIRKEDLLKIRRLLLEEAKIQDNNFQNEISLLELIQKAS